MRTSFNFVSFRLLICTVFLAHCFASISAAQQASSPNKGKLLTPETALTLRTLSDLQLSPGSSRLAFVVTEPVKGDARARHIWLYEKSSGTVRQFTYSAKSESSPRWSPDGTQLAFLSNREADQQQIYLLRLSGGEATVVTKGKRNVRSFAWSPDGKQIAFLAPDEKTEAEEKKEKEKDDSRVVDKDDKHSRVWLLTLATGEAKALTPAKWDVTELAWHPSGATLFLSATDHPESDQNTNRIMLLRASDGVLTQVLAPRGPFREIKASPDGVLVSYIGSVEDSPEPHDLLFVGAKSEAPKNMTGASLDRSVSEYCWNKDGSLLVLAVDGFRSRVVGFTAEGSLKDVELPAGDNISGFAAASDEFFFVRESATQPQELWVRSDKAGTQQLSHFNDAWKDYTLGVPSFFKYKSFDGLEIEAQLLLPSGSDGKKLPLITLVHGGPTGSWRDSIETWSQLLAARGYAVFMPNIRGSVGYGQKFVEMNRGDWGGADFKDVMEGVKYLIDKGTADPDRLGIGGWSYGGYMSEWAITQTTQFKAAVSGAGLSNLISEYGTEEHSSYDEWFFGLPYERPEGFLNSSPFLYLKNAKTPTLILQGEADTIDPLGQSQELYRGLKHYGVEAELVVYPRENHGFHEEKHMLDRLHRILDWYDKHLKPAPAEKK